MCSSDLDGFAGGPIIPANFKADKQGLGIVKENIEKAGPGLMFITLPVAFGHMPGGQVFGFLFFVLVGLAAWTSAISLMEPGVAWMVERFGLKRGPVCTMLGLLVWLLGIAALSSFNFGSNISLFGMNIFDFLDFITANVFLPLGGLFVAVFTGWVLNKRITGDELAVTNPLYYLAWSVMIRYIAPIAVAAIFIFNLIEKLG